MNQRMCAVCRNRKDKLDLVRIEKVGEKAQISNQKSDRTRGVYFCFDNSCIQKAEKTKILSRLLKIDVPKEFYSEIRDYIERKTNVK